MISIDSEKCIGCGLCASTCPEIFKINDETNKAEVISQEVGECDIDKSIEDCPVDAISK
jgi:ferredoxin